MLLVLAVFFLIGTAIAGVPSSGHAEDLFCETLANLRRYLAIDTTNPPGKEMAAALFLRGILEKDGIESELLDLGNDRANLVARLKGSGKERPVILLHHMDVVGAEAQFWAVPPFSGNVVGGYVYGRGAVDMKTKGMLDVMALIHLKRARVPLARDIILLAVADEEAGSSGAIHMVKHRPDLLAGAEFLINEGQCILADARGVPQTCFVATGEKYPLWLTLTFKGPPGHGSVPLPDSAVNKLLRAGNRILAHCDNLTVRPELRGYILARLLNTNRDLWERMRKGGEAAWTDPTMIRRLARDPNIHATLHDTISMTKLKGSDKVNSIPNEASLGLDCRLFPGTDPRKFLDDLKKIVGDPGMEITIDEMPQNASAAFSPVDSAFMHALGNSIKRKLPGVPIVPTLLLSSTDSLFFRSLGIHCYGFEPYALREEEYDRTHGNDERISVENVKTGTSLLIDLLIELCGERK